MIDFLSMSWAATVVKLLRGERRKKGTEEEREGGRGGREHGKGRRRRGLRAAGGEGGREEKVREHRDGCGNRIFFIVGLLSLKSSPCPRKNRLTHTFPREHGFDMHRSERCDDVARRRASDGERERER